MASSGSEPIRCWFDFASPYAYFAVPGLQEIARRHGRRIEYRPLLLFAVFRALGIAAPLDVPARKRYFFEDMARSAAFSGLPLAEPVKIPFASHLAARLFYGLSAEQPDLAEAYVQAVLSRFFGQGEDIASVPALQAVLAGLGVDPARAEALIAAGRDRLSASVEEAVAEGVIGSPYMVVDGEGFFGADRLPQIAWRLARGER
ncbi:MAG: 2-hydroxychromene-2-carboxylate isomerase [Methylobacterium sp.]|jgi:2-hydroxychromene-2-carboxylate isomerase|nr:2-hydroxychromene-2-carboxylate isomerase [Methylobacterium sp.]